MTSTEKTERFSLKDHLFNQEKITYLGDLLAKADPQFDADSFVKKVMTKLTQLELKERISWIATVLAEQLPGEFGAAGGVIRGSLPPPLDPEKTDNDFGNFIFAPFGEYVVRNGLSKKYLQLSLDTLQELTQRFSMEDSIRYFLNEFEEETMAVLATWVTHRHYHVRRLVSEGTRPLLPWSGRIKLPVEKTIPLLDQLYFDGTRYVTRSVANHMNDVAKKDPGLAVETLRRWQQAGKQDPKEMTWIISHSLRTLVKQGNADALALLGYESLPQVSVSDFKVAKQSARIAPGDYLEFSFLLTAATDQKLVIDYVIDYQKANGKTAARVFKLKKITAKKGEQFVITKRHLFPKDATTLKFYPGKHTVTLQINGRLFGGASFQLKS